MTRRHFIGIANWCFKYGLHKNKHLIDDLCLMFCNFNPRFKTSKFKKYLKDMENQI